jgi:hypothetical protein
MAAGSHIVIENGLSLVTKCIYEDVVIRGESEHINKTAITYEAQCRVQFSDLKI